MLPRLQQACEALPQEARERGVRGVAVTALDWTQAPLLEERFEPGVELEAALTRLREFAHDDCACEAELAWLLWHFRNGRWEQAPQSVRLITLGIAFGDGLAAQEGHIEVDFGLDEVFLAELAPWNAETRQHLQANIVQLLVFSQKVQERLRPQRRRLWSEDVDDWTQKLVQRLNLAQAESQVPHEA